jgi:hypothetical protein
MRRFVPLVVLVAAVAGMIQFSQGLGAIDTVLMLACGAVAGAALAAVAAARRK